MPDTNIITQPEDSDTLGGRISRARQSSNLTIEELARNAGVTVKTLRGWESDSLEPRSSRLNLLAGILGVSSSWLLLGIGTAPRGEDEHDELDILSDQLAELEETASSMAVKLKRLRKTVNALADAKDAGAD